MTAAGEQAAKQAEDAARHGGHILVVEGAIPTAFDGRSDYGPFIDAGIPAGGLFTGAEALKTDAQAAIYGGTAGVALDPCYHKACDTYDNNNEKVLGQMTAATGFTTMWFAYRDIAAPPPKTKTARKASASKWLYKGSHLQR